MRTTCRAVAARARLRLKRIQSAVLQCGFCCAVRRTWSPAHLPLPRSSRSLPTRCSCRLDAIRRRCSGRLSRCRRPHWRLPVRCPVRARSRPTRHCLNQRQPKRSQPSRKPPIPWPVSSRRPALRRRRLPISCGRPRWSRLPPATRQLPIHRRAPAGRRRCSARSPNMATAS